MFFFKSMESAGGGAKWKERNERRWFPFELVPTLLRGNALLRRSCVGGRGSVPKHTPTQERGSEKKNERRWFPSWAGMTRILGTQFLQTDTGIATLPRQLR